MVFNQKLSHTNKKLKIAFEVLVQASRQAIRPNARGIPFLFLIKIVREK